MQPVVKQTKLTELERMPTPVMPSSSNGPSVYQTPEFWQQEVRSKAPQNEYLQAMVMQEWFARMVQSPGSGHVWESNRQRCVISSLA